MLDLILGSPVVVFALIFGDRLLRTAYAVTRNCAQRGRLHRMERERMEEMIIKRKHEVRERLHRVPMISKEELHRDEGELRLAWKSKMRAVSASIPIRIRENKELKMSPRFPLVVKMEDSVTRINLNYSNAFVGVPPLVEGSIADSLPIGEETPTTTAVLLVNFADPWHRPSGA